MSGAEEALRYDLADALADVARLTAEVASRYCIVEDDAGHGYLCPAERREEATAALEAIEAYWFAETDDDPPPFPAYLVRLEGGVLTFAAPLVDGARPCP